MRKTWLEFCDKGISGQDISDWPITGCRKRGFMILSLLVFLFVLTSVAAYRRFRKSRDLDHTRQFMQCRIREVFKKERVSREVRTSCPEGGFTSYVAQYPCL